MPTKAKLTRSSPRPGLPAEGDANGGMVIEGRVTNVSPVQPQLLSRINEALVLRAIRQHGPSTRGELSHHMGVTFPTVAKAVGSLVEARLLEEFDDVMSGPGRPAKRLRLSKEKSQVVGVTVDVRSCEVAAAGFDGVVREATKQSFPTPRSYSELLNAIVKRVKSLHSDKMPILCIGISVVGLVDYRKQEIRLAANLPFLDGKKLAHDLSQLLHADCALVHDAHALCLAEYVYGEASNLDSFAVLDMCTGIGLGVMVNHMFLTGHSGFAGEMGHVPIVPNGRKCHCGRRGCLETVASEWALIERISEQLERPVDFDEIMTLALQGDKRVRSELNRLCKYLAVAMAYVVNLFNPQCVFLNGPLFDELPWLRDHLVSRARQLALDPAFADCVFVPTSGSHLLGAVATAISAVTSSRVHELKDTLNGITFSVTRRSAV
ncbi:MAG: ROK family transcriptional regulator [Pirellulales bacterium]